MTPQHLYLLSLGLSVTGAPHPRERAVVFPVISSCVAMVAGLNPLAVVLGLISLVVYQRSGGLYYDAREYSLPPQQPYYPDTTGWR